MDGSDYHETRDVAQLLRQHDLGLELSERPAPLCYSRTNHSQPQSRAPRYDMLAAAVTVSAALGFATLCLAIA